jgi:hypothetical protein
MAAKNFYAVMPDATVYRCKTEREVKGIDGAVIATDKDVTQVPSAVIVKLYNRVRPERPVTKFSDRATAEKRMEGVLDFVAKPNPFAPAPEAPKEKKEKAPKEPKEAGKRGAKVKEISPETVQVVIKLKGEGKTWAEICAELGEPHNFLHRVRPLLRAVDPSLVKPLGPGSPNYGKGPQPKAPRAPGEKKVRVAKKVDRGIPVETF